jgi:hypothetical protein
MPVALQYRQGSAFRVGSSGNATNSQERVDQAVVHRQLDKVLDGMFGSRGVSRKERLRRRLADAVPEVYPPTYRTEDEFDQFETARWRKADLLC